MQRDISGFDNLVQEGRRFIRQGCLQKYSRKGFQQRMFFLVSLLPMRGMPPPPPRLPIEYLLNHLSVFGRITVHIPYPTTDTMFPGSRSTAIEGDEDSRERQQNWIGLRVCHRRPRKSVSAE